MKEHSSTSDIAITLASLSLGHFLYQVQRHFLLTAEPLIGICLLLSNSIHKLSIQGKQHRIPEFSIFIFANYDKVASDKRAYASRTKFSQVLAKQSRTLAEAVQEQELADIQFRNSINGLLSPRRVTFK